MEVIETNKWLRDYLAHKKDSLTDNLRVHQQFLCKPLAPYFSQEDTLTIQQYLIQHGMFYPNTTDCSTINHMINDCFWERITSEVKRIEENWSECTGAIFIFPSDSTNSDLQENWQGVSGVSFADKLFLFLSTTASQTQLQALLTHEYSHVCRLQYLEKNKQLLTLADSLILEGIAETAVEQLIGSTYMSPFIHLYDHTALTEIWRKWISTHLQLPNSSPQHHAIMYGNEQIPKGAGYAIGYALICRYLQQHPVSLKALLTLPTSWFFPDKGNF